MSVIIAYIFYFVAATASPLQRRWLATRKNIDNKGQISFAFQVSLVVFVLGLLIPLFEPLNIVGDPFVLSTLGLIAGIFGAGYFAFSYIAQKHVEAGITTLVSNIYTPVTIVLATFFLRESLTVVQILGTVLLLVSVVIVSKKHRIGKFKFDRYFLLMLLSGICLGVCLVAERALQKTTGFTASTLISWGAQCFMLGLLTLVTKNTNTYSVRDIGATGILRFLQSLSWVVLIFVVGNLSIASSVTTFKVVLIFIAAALFLKERQDLSRKIVGSLIAVVGLLLMK